MGLLSDWLYGDRSKSMAGGLFGSPVAPINVTPSLFDNPDIQAAMAQYNAQNAAGAYDPNQNGAPYSNGLVKGPEAKALAEYFSQQAPSNSYLPLMGLQDLYTNPEKQTDLQVKKADLQGKKLTNTITGLGIPRARLNASIYDLLNGGGSPDDAASAQPPANGGNLPQQMGFPNAQGGIPLPAIGPPSGQAPPTLQSRLQNIPPALVMQALSIDPKSYIGSKFYEQLLPKGTPERNQAELNSAHDAGLTVSPDIRQGGTQLILDPNANNGRGGYDPTYKNPNIPQGYTVEEGPDGKQQVVPLPGGLDAIANVANRESGGKESGALPFKIFEQQSEPHVMNPDEFLRSSGPTNSLNGFMGQQLRNLGIQAQQQSAVPQPGAPPQMVPQSPPGQQAPIMANAGAAPAPQLPGNNQLPQTSGMSPEQFQLAKDQLPKQYEEAQTQASDSRSALQQLQQLRDEYGSLPQGSNFLAPGTGAGKRGAVAKGINTMMAGLGLGPVFDPNAVAGVEAANKTTFRLGAQLARTLGSREAAQIVQQSVSANPGIANTPKGFELVTRSLEAAAQRQVDRANFFTQWAQSHRDTSGADAAFNKERPVSMYAKSARVPASAIAKLRQNPHKAGDFDALAGPGMSQFILGNTQ